MTGAEGAAPGGRSRLRRLHSLSGVVPVGGFLAFHLYENSWAAKGADAYNRMSHDLQAVPFAVFLEVFVIALPLFFHGVYGLFLMAFEGPAPHRPGGRTLGSAQRATGVVVFAFVLFHYWTTRLVQLRDHESLDLFRQVQAAVANPWVYAFYLAGILSATFHFASGLWSFPAAWGITVSPAARRRTAYACAAVFLVLSFIGIRSISAFRM